MQAETLIQKSQEINQSQSEHSTPVVAQYIEQRKSKAAHQSRSERGLNMLSTWKKREYVIL